MLVEEATLEAVTIDPERKNFGRHAGRTDEARLRERINAKLQEVERPTALHACQLLVRGSSCANCATPPDGAGAESIHHPPRTRRDDDRPRDLSHGRQSGAGAICRSPKSSSAT